MKLLVANWKSNPASLGEAVLLARKIDRGFRKTKKVGVIIAPPFPFLYEISRIIKNSELGAQDVFWEDLGPYTGEISWHQLKQASVSYVIIGHSERRRWVGETDEMINKKVLASLKAGLKAILCVGEPLEVRRNGLRAAKSYVKDQLKRDLKGVSSVIGYKPPFIAAYEPIWAIGTGRPDKPEEAAEMSRHIKTLLASSYSLNPRVLYGGSVTSENVKNFLQYKEIDGALVGGASIRSEEFKKIVNITSKL